jgi:hypothetical protein
MNVAAVLVLVSLAVSVLVMALVPPGATTPATRA